ncbi:hypothetical protein DPM19_25745 [Actinomadura craniellae]|uniref:ATP-binding protein n=2 Tax=Actinomadura craniellae TaxID=2231787 RepID=A0A365H0C0_9ACTN|nr:hypothetical protein DPM19_25745 [Actinomadura craniellae]
MGTLGLPDELIEDGVLSVSELAANSHLHTAPGAGAELWVWGRTRPVPQLVVSVFDGDRSAMPRPGSANLLDERGKGLAIVDHLALDWGSHFSRGRLGAGPRPGKCVWFSLALSVPWPWTSRIISPELAARRLVDVLGARGLVAGRRAGGGGVFLVTAGELDVWVEPRSFSWCDGAGGRVRLPLLDLQDAAEHVVRRVEEAVSGRR